jgi:hypothetical protein
VTSHVAPTGLLETDLAGELRAILVRFLDPSGFRTVAALVERAEWDDRLMHLKRDLINEQLAPLTELLTNGAARGELRPDLDVRDAVSKLLGPLIFKRMLLSEDATSGFVDRLISEFVAAHAPHPAKARNPRKHT